MKTTILIFSFYYIWKKIREAGNSIDFSDLINHPHKNYLALVCILMLINWGLEALKWKLLVRSLETISFSTAVRSVLAGVTVSIFTPSRVGEFVGRIFFLEQADKIQATLKSFVGSIMQLLITVIGGAVAYFILEVYYHNFFQNKPLIAPGSAVLLISCFILLAGSLAFVFSRRNSRFIQYKKYIEVFTIHSPSELLIVFGLSLLRYSIFSFQYYLVLKFFDVNAGTTILFSLIALTFFVTSVIPTFSLTEIAVRGATAVFFFSTISVDSTAIVASSLLLWIINLAIPALIGSAFVLNLKFIKE